VRFIELQEKFSELKLMKNLKVAKCVIDVATNTIPRISVTDENKDAKEVVVTLKKGLRARIDAVYAS
jgi:hypothetical protein